MFYDRFEELCLRKGVSRQKACIDCGFSRTAWNKWKYGGIPNGDGIQRLADYFHVSTDYLLGKEDTKKAPAKQEPTDEDIMFALWGDTKDIDKDDLEDVKRYAAFIRERKKKK